MRKLIIDRSLVACNRDSLNIGFGCKQPGYGKIGLGIMLLALLNGCSPDERQQHVSTYVNKIKAKPPKPVEPIPSFEPLGQFDYPDDPHRRNPFKARITSTKAEANRPDMTRPKQPLEMFPIDDLNFVGTLEEGPKRWALIKTPQNIVQKIKVGDYMGQNYGRVLEIGSNNLLVEERFLREGSWEKRILTFKLSPTSVQEKKKQ